MLATFQELGPADRAELWACLALRYSRGLGALRIRRLLDVFGSAYAAVQACFASPRAWHDVGVASVYAGRDFIKEGWRDLALQEWTVLQREGCELLLWNMPQFPPLLQEVADGPLFFYYKGDLSLLSNPTVGVVGSRSCTHEGLAVAAFFSRGLSLAGVTVISGMAKGIDRAAHVAGLKECGKSIGVLGTGVDVVYPPGNADLAEAMGREGLLLSEFAPGAAAVAAHFPIRNRLISGLSRGVLVVEAAARSGSLITARLALEQGRDVFAVPGHTTAACSEGCRELIRRGAKAVFNADDILQELAPLLAQDAAKALEQRQQRKPQAEKAASHAFALQAKALEEAEAVLPEGELPWRVPEEPATKRKAQKTEDKKSVKAPKAGKSAAEHAALRSFQQELFFPYQAVDGALLTPGVGLAGAVAAPPDATAGVVFGAANTPPENFDGAVLGAVSTHFPVPPEISCSTPERAAPDSGPSDGLEGSGQSAECLLCALEGLGLSAEELLVAQQLATPAHIDDVCRALGMAVAAVSGTLAILEIRGVVQRHPGMVYSLARQG
ncbi:DNA-processing protein DprA [Desulfovibrio cuneatus]|uniref:DNA-processing protein DprA n=1 Tax=Desulfovibrio cuneatus TaxID=159728 RepID=UPI00042333A9|nr:DNA-processing protein DprA [Desulfovibrio cuneatus]